MRACADRKRNFVEQRLSAGRYFVSTAGLDESRDRSDRLDAIAVVIAARICLAASRLRWFIRGGWESLDDPHDSTSPLGL